MVKLLSGFHVSVQDLGRTGYRSLGVPISGAMDQYSSQLANHLLNNQEDDAVLEITLGACKLQFESDCTICITGADFSAQLDNKSIALNTIIQVKKESILTFGKRVYGVRTYLAISKGFKTNSILGSRSMYSGITPNSLIKKGAVLPFLSNQKKIPKTYASVKISQDHFQSKHVTCYEGPEFELLSEVQKKQLFQTIFTITPDNSRMGYKLEECIKNELPSMLTSAVLTGTVQLTPSGKLIILMKDGPATGGYPRVLQLSEVAINQLAQKTTGDTIQFLKLSH